MSIYKPCDIRGVFDKELFYRDAYGLGHAVGAVLRERSKKETIVAGDLRESTGILKAGLVKGLREEGVTVIDIGIVPTPLAYFARGFLKVEPLCIVTASHNPAEYNGFKLVLGRLPVAPEELLKIKDLAEKYKEDRHPARVNKRLFPMRKKDLTKEYVKFILSESLTGSLKVVIDASNGCYSELAPFVFQRLGYKVVKLFCKPDGRFPNHPPNPAVMENLKSLGRIVVEKKADIGVCFDGDGDRVAFVDEQGSPIPIDKVIVILARTMLKENPCGKIVYDIKASDIVPEEVRKLGGIPLPEKSGHTFIKTRMIKKKAIFGGEVSGHYFYRALNGGDDGLYSALLVSNILEKSSQPFSKLISSIPSYWTTPDIRVSYEGNDKTALMNRIKGYFPKEDVHTVDGVKVNFIGGWGLVRISVTEPVLTFRFESKTKSGLKRVVKDFLKLFPAPLRKKVYEIFARYIASHPMRMRHNQGMSA